MQTVAEPELASGATVLRFFDDQWTKDPEKIWRLSFPDGESNQLISKHYVPCDEADSDFIKGLVHERDAEFQVQRSGAVFRNSASTASKYVFRYGADEVYLVVLFK